MVLAVLLGTGAPVWAEEFRLSVYGGLFETSASRISGYDPGGVGSFDFNAGLTRNTPVNPPYFGIRGTWWRSDSTGLSVDFTHLPVTPDQATQDVSGFSALEFDDGINTVTVNAMRRFPMKSRITPYVGGGLGVAVPGVDIQTGPLGQTTTEYQYGGVVAQIQGGVEYQISERWSVFGEYQMNVIDLDVDLNGGGVLSTGAVSSAINVGAGFSF